MDFRGSFECGNGERCDTFTVTDAFSRFVLYCQDAAGDPLERREVFITEVLRRERIGLLPAPNGAFQVYFGQMYLEILEAKRQHSTKQTVSSRHPNTQTPAGFRIARHGTIRKALLDS